MRRDRRVSSASGLGGHHDAEFERLRWRLRLAIGALALVTGVGVLGFVLIAGSEHGLIDAVYMTIITLTTVGFGEIIDMSSHPAGRIFTIGLLLVGMGIVAYTVRMLAAFIIEGQLHHIFRRRRMEKSIAQLSDHYVVCGDKASSWYVAEELIGTGRSTVIVTPTEEDLEAVLDRLGDLPVVTGDPSDDHVLIAAGVERAAGIVVAMRNDKDIVLAVLTARRLTPRARSSPPPNNPRASPNSRPPAPAVPPAGLTSTRSPGRCSSPSAGPVAGSSSSRVRTPHSSPG